MHEGYQLKGWSSLLAAPTDVYFLKIDTRGCTTPAECDAAGCSEMGARELRKLKHLLVKVDSKRVVLIMGSWKGRPRRPYILCRWSWNVEQFVVIDAECTFIACI